MEKKQRVPKGEKYWHIQIFSGGLLRVEWITEENWNEDKCNFKMGNYFTDRKSALRMARKLRAALKAILKGADVIEMPSEEEIREKADDIAFTEEPYYGESGELEYGISNMSNSAIKMTNWLKSKIVK